MLRIQYQVQQRHSVYTPEVAEIDVAEVHPIDNCNCFILQLSLAQINNAPDLRVFWCPRHGTRPDIFDLENVDE